MTEKLALVDCRVEQSPAGDGMILSEELLRAVVSYIYLLVTLCAVLS